MAPCDFSGGSPGNESILCVLFLLPLLHDGNSFRGTLGNFPLQHLFIDRIRGNGCVFFSHTIGPGYQCISAGLRISGICLFVSRLSALSALHYTGQNQMARDVDMGWISVRSCFWQLVVPFSCACFHCQLPLVLRTGHCQYDSNRSTANGIPSQEIWYSSERGLLSSLYCLWNHR